MEKLYKLIVFIIALTASTLTVRAQVGHRSSYLASSIQSSSNFSWNTIFTYSKPKQALEFINYPNPATSSTTVTYNLPARANVVLRVIDLAGKQIAVLVKQQQNVGKHEYQWEFARHNITSGMYILILQVDNKSYSRKVIVQ